MEQKLNKQIKATNQKIKQYLALMGHQRAPFRKRNFSKPQILLILNLSVSKYFQEYIVTKSQISNKNSEPFQSFHLERRIEIYRPSKDEGINTRKSSFSVVVVFLYLVRQLFYYKKRQKFITECVNFLITKFDSFTRTWDSYYKM